MKKAIMATKIGMTQIFREDGTLVPVTVLEAGPCVVTQVKTIENDGYEAVQVGYGEAKERIRNSSLKTLQIISSAMRSRPISSRKATRSTRLQLPRVKASRAQSRDWDSTEDLWDTVPSSIATRVPTDLLPIRAESSRAKECPATWEAFRLPLRTWK